MNNINLFLFLVLFLIVTGCNENDVCEEKLENGINPKLILPEIDAWIIDEPEDSIFFSDAEGNKTEVIIELSLIHI